ncbi:hypothetical protein Q3G72_002237 [Acer saccharum]|nr:hypothetical protein Q3G72_002237 [Acer saccharum]
MGVSSKNGKWAVYGERKGLQSKSWATKDRQGTVDDIVITLKSKEKVKGLKRGVSQLSSEVSGSGMGIRESHTVSKADIRSEIIEETNQKVCVREEGGGGGGGGTLARKTQCPQLNAMAMGEVLGVASEEMLMDRLEENDGCLGGNQCVEESEGVDRVCEEHMVLSPRKVLVRKWRRAARKGHAPKGMLGVTSPIKRYWKPTIFLNQRPEIKSSFLKGKGNKLGC